MSLLPFSRNVAAGTTFLSPTDYQVYIDTTNGIATVVLPKISTVFSSFTSSFGNSNSIFGYRFKDVGGVAATNKIIFEGMDDDKINGVRKYEVETNGASGILIISGINNYTFVPDFTVTPSGSVDCFVKTISVANNTNDELSTFDECFIYLENGTYIFDVDYNFRTVGTVGNSYAAIMTNILSDEPNIAAGDVTQAERTTYVVGLQVDSNISVHLMTGKVVLNAGDGNSPVFKVGFLDSIDAQMQVLQVFMRAIKIA